MVANRRRFLVVTILCITACHTSGIRVVLYEAAQAEKTPSAVLEGGEV
jgi:hypothetical protein